MAAHAHGEGVDDETRQLDPQPERSVPQRAERPARRRAPKVDLGEVRGAICRTVAGVVRWIGLIFAVLLVLHVVLVIGEANPDNGITTFVKSWADFVAVGFQDLFSPDERKVRVLVNYGTAALFWLIVSAIVASVIRRIGGEKATS